MQPFCLLLACWEGGPSLKSKSKSTFDDLLRWSMSVIVVSSGLMQLIWKSMGDIMFHRKYNWEVRNTVIPSKLYLWPLCPGPVRVQGIVFLQQSAPSTYQRTGGRFRENCRSISGNFKCCVQQKEEEEKVIEICTLLCEIKQNHLCFLSYLHSVYYIIRMISKCGNGNVFKDALLL